jgi:hypothetical protein
MLGVCLGPKDQAGPARSVNAGRHGVCDRPLTIVLDYMGRHMPTI